MARGFFRRVLAIHAIGDFRIPGAAAGGQYLDMTLIQLFLPDRFHEKTIDQISAPQRKLFIIVPGS